MKFFGSPDVVCPNLLFWEGIELGHERDPVLPNDAAVQSLGESADIIVVAREATVDDKETVEQRPLAFNVLEQAQLPRLVVKPIYRYPSHF